MTTISATFNGKPIDLKMFLTTGIDNPSSTRINNNKLEVTWIFEEQDYEKALEACIDSIEVEKLDYWGVEFNSIS